MAKLQAKLEKFFDDFNEKHEKELSAAKEYAEKVLEQAELVGKKVEKRFVRFAKKGRKVLDLAIARSGEGIKLADKELDKMVVRSGVSKANILWGAALPFILVSVFVFSRIFPPLTAFFSGPSLYTYAGFSYEPNTKFDRSILTWGTDYLLAVVMGVFTAFIIATPWTQGNKRLILFAALLVGSYSSSTLAGALCHQFLGAHLNTAIFRFLWKICVGSVAAAGGFMGGAATELALMPLRNDEPAEEPRGESDQEDETQSVGEGESEEDAVAKQKEEERKLLNFPVPVVPTFCWVVYSIFFLALNSLGLFSMKQPACDIFLVGVTQAPPTIYLVLVLYSRKSWSNINVGKRTRRILLFGALTNIALLPGYDLFNFLRLPLGVINVILHSTLLISWGSQAYGFLNFARGIASLREKQE